MRPFDFIFNNSLTEQRYLRVSLGSRLKRFKYMLMVVVPIELIYIIRNSFLENDPSNTYLRVVCIFLFLAILTLISQNKIKSYAVHRWVSAIAVLFTYSSHLYFASLNTSHEIMTVAVPFLPVVVFLTGWRLRDVYISMPVFVFLYILALVNADATPVALVNDILVLTVSITVSITAKRYEEFYNRLNFLDKQTLQSLNKELDRKSESLKEISEFRKQLITHLAHDIKSPMGNLSHFLDFMEDDSLTTEERKIFVQRLRDRFDKTDNLIQSILFWVKSQIEGFVVAERPCHIDILLQDSVEIFSEDLKEKNIHLKIQSANHTVICDPYLVQTVVRNIVSNSSKFTSTGGKILISTRAVQSRLEVSIQDSGMGMTQEKVESILTREHIDSLRGTSKEKGFGVGLKICLDLLQAQGSDLQIDSEIGKGTTMYFDLLLASKKDESEMSAQIQSLLK